MEQPRYPYVHVVGVPPDEVEEVSYLLWELGAQGIEERDATTLNRSEQGLTLVASFADAAQAGEAIAALAPRPAHLAFVEGDGWRDAYKQYFKVTRLGRRLVIRPSWEPFQPAPGDVVVTVDPGRAFGTGTHESTRLLMQALDGWVAGGERVLDVGCGTGILAICALKLGGREALCLDVDPDAVEVTRENAAANQVQPQLLARAGSVDGACGTHDLVLANIQASVLVPLAPALAACVAPGGLLMLSGILCGQEPQVLAAYPGFWRVAAPTEGEWIALILKKA